MQHNQKVLKDKKFEQSLQEQKKFQQNQIQNQKPKSQTMIDRVGQMYNAAKLQQNQNYINKKQKNQEEFKKDAQGKKKYNKKKYNKKIQLFQNSSNSDQQTKQKQANNKNVKNTKNNQTKKSFKQQQKQQKKQPKQQKKQPKQQQKQQCYQFNQQIEHKQNNEYIQFDQNKSPQQKNPNTQSINQCEQQQRDREQKLKQMLYQNIKKHSEQKQLSFSLLIQKVGNDRTKLKKLVYQPIPQNYRAICTFRRISVGFTQIFQLVLQDEQRCIFYCQNQRGSIGANYYISLTKQMDKKSQSYLGKLRGNSTGSVYHLYDSGGKPQKKINRKDWRITMARIQYQTNFMGINGPRKIKVITPKICTLEELDTYKLSDTQEISMFQPPIVMYRSCYYRKYRNKQPKWNERLKSYALNFGGRVKQASIKNFLLIVDEEGNQDKQSQMPNVLIFGKIDDNSFSVQATYPLSLYQAFGIVVSQFDFKLNCE